MMKRLLCFLLGFVILFGLCACGDVATQITEPSQSQSNITTATNTESTTEATESTTEPTTEPTTGPSTEPTTEVTIKPDTEQGVMVWIPTKGGTKYHSKDSCSNMIDPEKVTQSVAESRGFTPCKKCY